MRSDPSAIFFQFEVSPEALSAQRIQDAKDLAQYRARKMAAYKAWVSPEAIKARVEKHEKDAASALEKGKMLSNLVMEGWEYNKALAASGERGPIAELKNIRVIEK